jgi:hypothetical protein
MHVPPSFVAPQNTPSLHQTNRLSMFLASNGYRIFREKRNAPFAEAEFDGVDPETAADTASFRVIPPEFDILYDWSNCLFVPVL